MGKIKVCRKCGQELPMTAEYFHKRKDSKDGFRNICKECREKQIKQYYEENKERIAERHKQYYEENKEDILKQNKQYYEENKEKYNQYSKQYYVDNKEYYNQYSKQHYKDNKECYNQRHKQYYEENKEKMDEYYKQYREKNKENIAEYREQYREENKEKIAKQQRQYYEENKDKMLEYSKLHYERNKKKIAKQRKLYFKENPDAYRRAKQKYRAKKAELSYTLTVKQWNEIKQDFDNSCAYCGMTEEEHLREWEEQLHQEHFIPLSKGGGYTKNNIIPSCRSCNSSKHNRDFFEWYPTHEHYSKEREQFILDYLGYNGIEN